MINHISQLTKQTHALNQGLTDMLNTIHKKQPFHEKEIDMDAVMGSLQKLTSKMTIITQSISGFRLETRKRYDEIIRKLRYYSMLTRHLAEDMDEIKTCIGIGNRITDETAFPRLAQSLWILDKTLIEIEKFLGKLNRRKIPRL